MNKVALNNKERKRLIVHNEVLAGRLTGPAAADLLRAYPALSAEDLANAWAYYRANRNKIDEQIAANEPA